MTDLTLYSIVVLAMLLAVLAFKYGYMSKREAKGLAWYGGGFVAANLVVENAVPHGLPQAFAYTYLLLANGFIAYTVVANEKPRT